MRSGACPGSGAVTLSFDVMTPEEKAALTTRLRGGVTERTKGVSIDASTRVLAVCSGKGGVGKSSLTVNLAAAFSALGLRTGVLDADVYGYSIPGMLGIHQRPIAVDQMIVPPVRGDLKVMSIGFFLDDNAPVMWRGPMLHRALEQFLSDVHWGELDWLVVDMPPGTGDVSISLGQLLPRAEVIVVTTPQRAAQEVAVRAAEMARKTNMRLLGVVENMSYLVGTGQAIFGEGGGEALASELGVPLLGRVPLDPALREAADAGDPIVLRDPEAESSQAIVGAADAIVAIPREVGIGITKTLPLVSPGLTLAARVMAGAPLARRGALASSSTHDAGKTVTALCRGRLSTAERLDASSRLIRVRRRAAAGCEPRQHVGRVSGRRRRRAEGRCRLGISDGSLTDARLRARSPVESPRVSFRCSCRTAPRRRCTRRRSRAGRSRGRSCRSPWLGRAHAGVLVVVLAGRRSSATSLSVFLLSSPGAVGAERVDWQAERSPLAAAVPMQAQSERRARSGQSPGSERGSTKRSSCASCCAGRRARRLSARGGRRRRLSPRALSFGLQIGLPALLQRLRSLRSSRPIADAR